jgi:hypothetical protein
VPDSEASITGAAFQRSRGRFDTVTAWLGGGASAPATHAELEAQLQTRGRDLLRQLLQDPWTSAPRERLGLPGERRRRVDHRYLESGHDRGLASVLGPVSVTRIAYRAPGPPACTPPTPRWACPRRNTPTGCGA